MPDKNVLQNGLTPCRLPAADWPVCYENNCYHNHHCPVYQGSKPCPVRDYIPLPPVFIFVSPGDALPFFYRIPVILDDPDQ